MSKFYVGQTVVDTRYGHEFVVEGIGDGDYVCADEGIYGRLPNGRFNWTWQKYCEPKKEELRMLQRRNHGLKVGDKVRLVGDPEKVSPSSKFHQGEVYTVSAIDSDNDFVIDGTVIVGYEHEQFARYFAEQSPDLSDTVLRLVKQVEHLTAEVDELKASRVAERKVSGGGVIFHGQDVTVRPMLKRNNELRAEAINYAKDVLAAASQRINSVKFFVNRDKGVVTAVLVGRMSGKTLATGLARLNPGDVFNEDIGKAIAYQRMDNYMGTGKVSDILKNAPQPDSKVAGQIVLTEEGERREIVPSGAPLNFLNQCHIGSHNGITGKIVEDTGVDYR